MARMAFGYQAIKICCQCFPPSGPTSKTAVDPQSHDYTPSDKYPEMMRKRPFGAILPQSTRDINPQIASRNELPSAHQPIGLTFEREHWKVRLYRLYKKAFCASNGEGSTTFRGTSEGSTNGDEPAMAYQEYLREGEREDSEQWTTDLTVVDGHILDSSQHDRSEPATSDFPGKTSNSPDDDNPLVHRYFGNGLIGSVVASVVNFCEPKFADPELELQYTRERWFNNKIVCLFVMAFLYVNYILYLIFNHSQTKFEFIAYYGIATLLTVPGAPFVMMNLPRTHPIFYQIWLMFSSFWWGGSEIVQTRVCHYLPSRVPCHGKDFLFMTAYSIALPVLVLFGCNLKRLYFMIGSLVEFVFYAALFLPKQHVFVRNQITFFLFMAFFMTLHYWMEAIDRRMFILRAQLKIALKAQQKAQLLQKQAASSKRRFVSYIFHETRVPLNSAMLAFQNLQSEDAFRYAKKDQEVEIQALETSMEAMKQVLDDVLDLQRMDSGKFALKSEPFPFRTIVQAILGPLKVATAAKGLALEIELDPKIDQLGQQLQSMDDLWVLGDALRFRQVFSNLCSNAVKFTESGCVTVRTILVQTPLSTNLSEKTSDDSEKTLQDEEKFKPNDLAIPCARANSISSTVQQRSLKTVLPELLATEQRREQSKQICIRIEVQDTGVGIKPSETSRLFSPFFQTRLGAMQAGKGSGLGLAIIRQIITISGGKLGVRSKKGTGSCFWFEMVFDPASDGDIETCLRAASGGHQPLAAYQETTLDPTRSSAESTRADSAPRKTTVGWTDAQLITNLTESGELRVHRSSLKGRGPSSMPPSIILRRPESNAVASDVTEVRNVPDESEHPRPPPMVKAKSFPVTTEDLPPLSPSLDENPEQPPLAAPTKQLNVLVVDDDSLTRKLLSRMLEKLGCVVTTAQDGQEAVDLLLGNGGNPPRQFDMISLDNSMPIKNGPQCVKELRKAGRTDYVVGATGNALKSDQSHFFEAGADKILPKPVMLRELKEVLIEAERRRNNSD